MKKLLLITTLFLAFACSKDEGDDDNNSSEPQTFLEKYDGYSWKSGSEIQGITNGTYFYTFVDYSDPDDIVCGKLKKGVQTVDGVQAEVIIIKNEPDELIMEVKIDGVLGQRSRWNVNGETLTDRTTYFDEDGSSSEETYTWTRTSASYSDYCN